MARVTGFRCDGIDCSTLSEAEKLPPGWLTLQVAVNGQGQADMFHLCSNACLTKLAKARRDAEWEADPSKAPSYFKQSLARRSG